MKAGHELRRAVADVAEQAAALWEIDRDWRLVEDYFAERGIRPSASDLLIECGVRPRLRSLRCVVVALGLAYPALRRHLATGLLAVVADRQGPGTWGLQLPEDVQIRSVLKAIMARMRSERPPAEGESVGSLRVRGHALADLDKRVRRGQMLSSRAGTPHALAAWVLEHWVRGWRWDDVVHRLADLATEEWPEHPSIALRSIARSLRSVADS